MPAAQDHAEFKDWAQQNPEEALALIQRLRKYVVTPHPGQKVIFESDTRNKVLNCGRRWGKTVVGAKALIDATRAAPPGSVTWWVAPTYKVVKRGYREVVRQLPPELLAKKAPEDTLFDSGRTVILKLKNGSQIEFYSAERPEGMLGEGVSYVVMDEAATMPSRIWEQVVSPTLADKKGGCLLISTPRGRNWFYDRYVMGQDSSNDLWASWTFTTYDNPYVDDAEIDARKAEIPRVLFDQEFLAKFLAGGSAVFEWPERRLQPNQILDNGMIEDIKVSGPVFLGIDLAKTTDFTVLYGAMERNSHNCYFERFNDVRWSEQKRRIKRAVGKLMRAGAENVTLVMDSTGVGDPIVEDMEDAGFDVIGINFTTFKSKMVVALAKDLEVGRAILLKEGHLNEFQDYQMGQSEKTKKITYSAPEGKHDDVVSAKMLSHWGMTTEGSPSVQSLSGDDTGQIAAEIDPWDEPDETFDDYSDLVDDDEPADDLDLDDPRNANDAIGLGGELHEMTYAEMLERDELWLG